LHKPAISRRTVDGLSITAVARVKLSYSESRKRKNERKDREKKREKRENKLYQNRLAF